MRVTCAELLREKCHLFNFRNLMIWVDQRHGLQKNYPRIHFTEPTIEQVSFGPCQLGGRVAPDSRPDRAPCPFLVSWYVVTLVGEGVAQRVRNCRTQGKAGAVGAIFVRTTRPLVLYRRPVLVGHYGCHIYRPGLKLLRSSRTPKDGQRSTDTKSHVNLQLSAPRFSL
jgi:hypothetical protein